MRRKMKTEKDREQDRTSAIRAQIDENLKRVYAEKVEEELPDRFKQLLAQLQAQPLPSRRDKEPK